MPVNAKPQANEKKLKARKRSMAPAMVEKIQFGTPTDRHDEEADFNIKMKS